MNDYSKFVPNVHFEQIPIRNLVSNQDYQRNLSQAHIARAAAHFDIFQINPVKVSRRDGIHHGNIFSDYSLLSAVISMV